jgi:hypothetical protein
VRQLAAGHKPRLRALPTSPPTSPTARSAIPGTELGGTALAAWAAALKITVQIVAKRDRHAFQVLPRRWVGERTFAWISKHRRTTRDYERLPASHEAMILWAMIALMTQRLAQAQ